MAIELKELVIRGFVGTPDAEKKEEEKDPCDCEETDEAKRRQEELTKFMEEKNER